MKMRGIPGAGPRPARASKVLTAPAASTCATDRIAAVYDPGTVTHALGRKHNVAFFAIEGAIAPRTLRAIRSIAESAFGVDKGSARVSGKTRSLSLAFDPNRVAFSAIQNILDRKLAAMRLSLLPMRILDEPSKPGPATTQPA